MQSLRSIRHSSTGHSARHYNPFVSLPSDYAERVYAGVLGKIIGVYLGRPFEGWDNERIERDLGEITGYVHDRLGLPLVVADDDISGTFTFIRALEDEAGGKAITPAAIGRTWLNYLVEERTVLWWGGLGNSTEHTAYLRLKHGIEAPASGSITTNGQVVAEQIGAQIFIDGWAMVAPGDPELAADLARRAASVSHDGAAIHGAQVMAALEAAAFVESDIERLLDTAVAQIPGDCLIARMIAEIRDWNAAADRGDWRSTFARIQANYGYDRYGGNCHMVPNHAVIVLALVAGEADFDRALMIANTAGWDTDCNSGNVGCLMGIRGGLAAIDERWRTPVADRILLPSADGGRVVTDATQVADRLVALGHRLAGSTPPATGTRKAGARFHFEYPDSLQGFTVTGANARASATDAAGATGMATATDPDGATGMATATDAAGATGMASATDPDGATGVATANGAAADAVSLSNVTGHSASGERALAIRYPALGATDTVRVTTATFFPLEFDIGYRLFGSPSLHAGQELHLTAGADPGNGAAAQLQVVAAVADNEGVDTLTGPTLSLDPGVADTARWVVPETDGNPILSVGVQLAGPAPAGTVYLDALGWTGVPNARLGRPAGSVNPRRAATVPPWRRAWVDGIDQLQTWVPAEEFRLVQNRGTGLLIRGDRDWSDYTFAATVRVHMALAGGIGVRCQGMRRYYALLITGGGSVRLVRRCHDQTVLAEAPLHGRPDQPHHLTLTVTGATLRGSVDGREVVSASDPTFTSGAVALLAEAGRVEVNDVTIRSMER